ncbi:trichohyalin-like isoform X3 [Hemicordylus capensis]|uniref:trichohyalin-like isoform X3 n=1 Tax=Hemicordylus capensis TaxID=884348 RepID=UPI00230341C7|nr:trichohyalin-like isoform X3 [Hemicordylus capensis]
MDVALKQGNNLKQRGSGNFEEENAWLQEWIHEELAHGEVWQKQYESLLRHQKELCSLLQTKSLKPLEKKTRAMQEELEEIQEALRECQNRSRQRQLHIHKQEKENQRMAETVKELEKKVFKQQLEEKSNKDILKELRTEGNELKRHLSEWETKWQTKNDRVRQRQHQIEKLNATIQGLSLMSQELHKSIIFMEDRVMEAQQEAVLLQKEASSGQAENSTGSTLWEERACDQMLAFCVLPEETSMSGTRQNQFQGATPYQAPPSPNFLVCLEPALDIR